MRELSQFGAVTLTLRGFGQTRDCPRAAVWVHDTATYWRKYPSHAKYPT